MKRSLKITRKGQVTLRREVLDQLGVRPGDRIVVEPVAPGRVELRRAETGGGLRAFIGCLKAADSAPLSIEDIDRFAREGWAGLR